MIFFTVFQVLLAFQVKKKKKIHNVNVVEFNKDLKFL